MNPAFRLAIINSNLDMVKHFLNKGEDVNSTDNNNYSALMLAIKYGDENIVKFLLDNKATIDYVSPNGITALQLASESENSSIQNMLFEYISSSNKNADDTLSSTLGSIDINDDVMSIFDGIEQDSDDNVQSSKSDAALLEKLKQLEIEFENTSFSNNNSELDFFQFSDESVVLSKMDSSLNCFEKILYRYKQLAIKNNFSSISYFEKRDELVWKLIKLFQDNKTFFLKARIESIRALKEIFCISLPSNYSPKLLYEIVNKKGCRVDEIIRDINYFLNQKLISSSEDNEFFSEIKIIYNELRNNLEKIVLLNHRLIYKKIRRFFLYSEDREELIQECFVYIYKSACRYALVSGTQFSTYATFWLLAAFSFFTRFNNILVKLPAHKLESLVVSKQKRISWKEYILDNDLPSSTLYFSMISCDAYLENYNFTDKVNKNRHREPILVLQQNLQDLSEKDVEQYFLYSPYKNLDNADSNKKLVNLLLEDLLDKEKQIIIQRFGVNNHLPKSLEEIGKIFGVTRERIRQIEEKSIEKLRKKATILGIDSEAIYDI